MCLKWSTYNWTVGLDICEPHTHQLPGAAESADANVLWTSKHLQGLKLPWLHRTGISLVAFSKKKMVTEETLCVQEHYSHAVPEQAVIAKLLEPLYKGERNSW